MWYSFSQAFGGGILPPSSARKDQTKGETPRVDEEVLPAEIEIPRAEAETLESKLRHLRTDGKFPLPPGCGEPTPQALNDKAINPPSARADQHEGFGGDATKGDNWRHYTPENPLSYYSG